MKKIFTPALAVLIVLLLAACNSQYYQSPNNMRNTYGSLLLNTGSVMKGYLSINAGEMPRFGPHDFITIKETPKSKGQRIYVHEIKEMNVRGEFYAPIETDQRFFNRQDLMFARRMTRPNSKIKLFELYQRQPDANNNGSYTTSYTYYVQFPFQQRFETWRIDGNKFVPNFEEKMSDYVKDHPTLAEKIKNKKKGYFYPLVTLNSDKRLETMQRIIDEYNSTP
jgi:hypothetical protein